MLFMANTHPALTPVSLYPLLLLPAALQTYPTQCRKVDFACLGLRPHLMLKLVKKPPPSGEGPHGFSDLFSTVVVENTEAPLISTAVPGIVHVA